MTFRRPAAAAFTAAAHYIDHQNPAIPRETGYLS